MDRARRFSMKILQNTKGLTLTELLVAVAIVSVMVTLATVGAEYIQAQRLTTASRELLGDLQRIRQKALTQSLPLNGSTLLNRGFGIRFTSGTSYVTFEFIDSGLPDFQYDDETEEYDETGKVDGGGVRVGPTPKALVGDVTVTLGNAGDPTGDPLIYDKRGIPRASDWQIPPSRVYVFRSDSASSQARCVLIDQVRIREGRWDGAACIVS